MLLRDTAIPNAEPIWLSVADFKIRYSIGHTTLYKILGQGSIEARKYGDRTLINRQSADSYFASLPKFRAVA